MVTTGYGWLQTNKQTDKPFREVRMKCYKQTDRQTDRPFKEVRIKSDTQTDRHTDTKPYFRLRLVTGGYGCLRMLKDVYEWLRVVKDGDGRLRGSK